MEHIKKILEVREATLFATRGEKGSREWNAFNSVRHDRVEMFSVASPRNRETLRYPNILHISREPRHLTAKFAR